MKRRMCAAVGAAMVAALGLVLRPAGARAEEWRAVGGPLKNVSGMALVENAGGKTTLLVVHDNKRETEGRAGLVTLGSAGGPAVYTPLPWPKDGPGGLPIDLEAVSTVPGAPGEFVALTSDGTAFHVKVDAGKAALSVVRSFKLPAGPEGSNYEGCAVFRPSGAGRPLYIAWAHRGKIGEPGVLRFAPLDLQAGAVAPSAQNGAAELIGTTSLTLPWPTTDVRHISDLKIDGGGNVFVSSASDPGDDGPFSSALYLAGTLTNFSLSSVGVNLTLSFQPNPAPVPLRKFFHHKVEAFDLIPGAEGGVVFGTDDEALGTWVLRD